VARTPQFTGGNYSAGDYGWYDPQTDPSTPEGTEQGIPKPYGINVTTPPTKLDYIDGERIDFGGMVVQLVNQDGSIFTDSNYPDGVVPFQELVLPKYAVMGEGYTTYTSDLDTSPIRQPIPAGGRVSVTWWRPKNYGHTTYDYATFTITANNGTKLFIANGGWLCVFAMSPGEQEPDITLDGDYLRYPGEGSHPAHLHAKRKPLDETVIVL
jgi:hypothetical protein